MDECFIIIKIDKTATTDREDEEREGERERDEDDKREGNPFVKSTTHNKKGKIKKGKEKEMVQSKAKNGGSHSHRSL